MGGRGGDSGYEASRVVDGKDLSSDWTYDSRKYKYAIDAIIHEQGFDGKPRVVDSDEFERLASMANDGNGLVMMRGYSAPDQETLDSYRKALYEGDFYVDCSGGHMFGRGMYANYEEGTSPTRQQIRDTEKYAGKYKNNVVGQYEVMTLDKSARIATHDQLIDMLSNKRISDIFRNPDVDTGVLAAAIGYDAIQSGHGTKEIVVLNRTKLIIRKP